MCADHLSLLVEQPGVRALEGPVGIGAGVNLRTISLSSEQQCGAGGRVHRRLLRLQQQGGAYGNGEANDFSHVYSERNALIGSVEAARRAGISPATHADIASANTAPAMTHTSCPATS